jgi:DNA polymerase-3 subunit alpha
MVPMPHADFVHLRVHTAYSLSEGALKIKELTALCRSLAMPAVAVTDTCNLFGALEFALAAADAGIQPIIGTLFSLSRPGEGASALRLQSMQRPDPDGIVLLAQSEQGYRNLSWLVSRAYLDSDQAHAPQLPLTALEGRTDGLIALTGGPKGPVGRLLGANRQGEAEAALRGLSRLFPDRLYVELMRHGLEEEERIEPALLDLAYALGLPLVATNDCQFADAAMYEAHDALLCIAAGRYVSEPDRPRVTPEHRFRSAAEMRDLFADLPEAVDNTLVIARRCAVMPARRAPILPAFPTEAGRTEAEELEAQARAGLDRRLAGVLPASMVEEERARERVRYVARLDYELGVICGMGFAGYFLIVSDFMKWTRRQGIPVGVRGSGATSVVAWSLDITSLDPLRFNLVFERFLNPERVSMPDFDIDFCQERRDEVIDYVRGKYGHDRVAQIITFGKLQARAVLRDVGRVLQMPYGQVDRLCKLVPNNPTNPVTLSQAIEGEPALRAERDGDPQVAHLIDLAMKLEGLYRHASTHAAGVVIGDRPLEELVPLYRDPRSPIPATQFNMKYVELAGLVKFDFLGLKTLTVIAKTEALLAAQGQQVSVAAESFDDTKTYEMLSRGETTGVFQLESSGMRDLLRRMRPDRIEDLIALVALYRPGPMDSIPVYIACKHGREKPHYLHPKLEPILAETFGVMTYQEDVMMIARVLAGYSLGQADLLRRAMGKKIKAEMDAERARFLDGAMKNGIEDSVAKEIFEQAAKFAGYGFNKGHAAAYAQVAYQTAWLKANHPVEFFAASMTLDLGNTDKLALFRQELARIGVRLLPPDINRSEADFAVERMPDGEKAIRYALGAIKGVGLEAMRALVAEREARGAFGDLFDFASRFDAHHVNKRQIENLARAGAFAGLGGSRAQIVAVVDTLMRHAQSAASDRESGQDSLFGGTVAATLPQLPDIPEWDTTALLREEFDAVGFYLSAHPLDAYDLRRLGVAASAEIPARSRQGQTQMRLAGVIMAKREMNTKSGSRLAFVTLSDASGVYEVTLFAELLATARPVLELGAAVVVTIEIQARGEDQRLAVQAMEPLDQALSRTAARLTVYVEDIRALAPLRSLLDRDGPGRCRVALQIQLAPTEEVEIELPGAYAIGAKSRGALKTLPGVLAVEEV